MSDISLILLAHEIWPYWQWIDHSDWTLSNLKKIIYLHEPQMKLVNVKLQGEANIKSHVLLPEMIWTSNTLII